MAALIYAQDFWYVVCKQYNYPMRMHKRSSDWSVTDMAWQIKIQVIVWLLCMWTAFQLKTNIQQVRFVFQIQFLKFEYVYLFQNNYIA